MLPRSAVQLADLLRTREVSSREVLEEHFRVIDRTEPSVRAFLSLTDRDTLRAQAEAIDAERVKGDQLPRFAGVPIAVKDNIAVVGSPLTAGSRMLEHYRTPFDATVVRRLRGQRLLIIGKTNLDEFGFGSSTENSAFHPTMNPWDVSRVPGGSSGGSAAAVAAGMTPWALGSDTGGSVRQPASLCGVVGHRPTYGRVSRYGLVAFASSLDTIGPIATTPEDAAALLGIIEGRDPLDATSVGLSGCPPLPETPRAALLGELLGPPCGPAVASAILGAAETMRSLGWEVAEERLHNSAYALPAYYTISSVEAASNLARYDGVRYGYRAANPESLDDMITQSRVESLGTEAKRRVLLGTFAASAGYADQYYDKACRARRLIRDDHLRLFEGCDVIVSPVSPTTAWKLGEKSEDPMAMYLTDILSVSAALAGLPAVVVPCGLDPEGMPIGVQLAGRPGSDAGLLRAAALLAAGLSFAARPPAR